MPRSSRATSTGAKFTGVDLSTVSLWNDDIRPDGTTAATTATPASTTRPGDPRDSPVRVPAIALAVELAKAAQDYLVASRAPNTDRACLGTIGTGRLGDQSVALILKRHADRAGIDPITVAGHRCEPGWLWQRLAAGIPERVIANRTGHNGTSMLRHNIGGGVVSVRHLVTPEP